MTEKNGSLTNNAH